MHDHLWTYRLGRSECVRCHITVADTRGLPHGHYVINGRALTAGRLQAAYTCPICLTDINPRVVLGELKILCAGSGAHDIVRLGRAMPKEKRDYIVARQQADAVDVLDGLKEVIDMPIVDLQQNARACLKRAGIIRLGHKEKSKKSGKEYPVEDSFFVLKDAPELVEIYGAQPKHLNIYLPFNEVDRNLIAWHQYWRAGGLMCRGDGQQIEYAVDPKTGEVIVKNGQALATGKPDGIKMTTGHPVQCSGMDHDLYPRCQQCRPGALLVVLIREIPRLAYYQVATGSIHNIVNLTGQMRWVKENIGRLQGVPFILERRPDKISTPSGPSGKRVRREKYLLHLEPDPEWVKAMLAEFARRALPGGAGPVAAIPAQVTEVEAFDDEPVWEPADYDYNGGEEAKSETDPGDGTEQDADEDAPTDDSPDGSSNQKNRRPLSIDRIIEIMAEKVRGGDGTMATKTEKSFIAGKCQECFNDTEDPSKYYHAILKGLWNISSPENLSKSHVKAMCDWLLLDGKQDDSGDYPLHPAAPEEAWRVAKRVMMGLFDRPIQTRPEPYCPECGARMVLRRPRPGQDWKPFWGCSQWPSCHGKRQIRPDGRPESDDETPPSIPCGNCGVYRMVDQQFVVETCPNCGDDDFSLCDDVDVP